MTHFLALGDPQQPPDLGAFDVPGGFGWWYFDLLTDDGMLLVVIVSFGLPFLPDRGADPARERPSLNVALYQGNQPRFYLLQEYAPDECSVVAERVQLADSRCESRVEGGVRTLTLRLDAALPGTRDRLKVEADLSGPVPAFRASPHPVIGDHRWTPLAIGAATATVRVGDRPIAVLEGRGYHDRNLARVPLASLGCTAWWWARAPYATGERIYYVLWGERSAPPQTLALDVRRDGSIQIETPVVEPQGRRLGRWGLWWWRTYLIRGDGWEQNVTMDRVVDDSPFYLRFQGSSSEGPAIGEWVVPGRVGAWWHRWLVRMAVHKTKGPNSAFVTLFTGEDPGRARIGAWLGRRREIGVRTGPEAR